MKITLINGSPKVKNSASGILLETIENIVNGRAEIKHLHYRKANSAEQPAGKAVDIETSDALVFAVPLYVDGIPGHLLACLEALDNENAEMKGKYVYGISNCGFYEGDQARFALDILKNCCVKSGAVWGGGIGIGGGGAVTSMPQLKDVSKAKSPVAKEMVRLTENMLNKRTQENVYPSILLPRGIYQAAAHMNWKRKIRKNGGKVKDLENKW